MSIARIRPRIVYHYCSLDTFYSIFCNSTIRLSNISKSNDSEEITYLLPEMKQFCSELFGKYNDAFSEKYRLNENFVSDYFDSKFNELSLNFYVACFSEEADLLSQWRGYANDARGVSIGFLTEALYPLASSTSSNYNFSQVRYSLDDLYEQVESYIVKNVRKDFTGDSRADSLFLINIVDTTLSTIFYNSMLYKNPHFIEEKEWRLVYNPLGNIRRVMDKNSYYDRLTEVFSASTEKGGFARMPMKFHISDNKIVSHIDLSFSSIKNSFVKEIIIGPKSNIDVLDLELFLLSNGFNPMNIDIRKSYIPYR